MTMISLPPAKAFHQNISHTFTLLMKKASKDFTVDVCLWTSTYVTDTLNWCLNSCLHNINTNVTLFNLALSLGSALEEMDIHIALDLEWDSLILEFIHGLQYLRSQVKTIKLNPLTAVGEPMDQESHAQQPTTSSRPFPHKEKTEEYREIIRSESLYLENDFVLQIEESLITFFRLFLKNYSGKTSVEAIRRIHEFVVEEYGEKLIPHLAKHQELLPLKRKKTGIVNRLRQPNVIKLRRVQWKSKRICIGKLSKQRNIISNLTLFPPI